MFWGYKPDLKLTAAHKNTLQGLTIDAQQPGSILHDFDVLLNKLRAAPLPLTASEQLPMKVLADINNQLKQPIQMGLKRPQQKSYPHIHGLYLLVRASGLSYVDAQGDKPLLIIEDSVYQQWITLTPTERYCTLLETWMLRGLPELLGDRPRPLDWLPENFSHTAHFFTEIPADGLPVIDKRDVEGWLMHRPGWHNLGLMHLFGMIDVESAAPEPGQGWRIKTIHRTAVGDALVAVLYHEYFKNIKSRYELEDEMEAGGEVPIGAFQPVLTPYFPEWKNTLSLPKWAFRNGLHIFKVSLGSVWRQIKIDGQHTLDDLADIILQAFDFDDTEHLYEFSYRNRFGATKTVWHPYMEETYDGPFTSEILIGDVPLLTGQTMIFHFDFGDDWQFAVTLESFESGNVVKKPSIGKKHGKAPEQYPSWEDDDDGDFFIIISGDDNDDI